MPYYEDSEAYCHSCLNKPFTFVRLYKSVADRSMLNIPKAVKDYFKVGAWLYIEACVREINESIDRTLCRTDR